MRKLKTFLGISFLTAGLAIGLLACVQAPATTAASPQPLVIQGKSNVVVSGGTYSSVLILESHGVEVKNVTVDGSGVADDVAFAGLKDCLYVRGSSSVNFHDNSCKNNKRQGVAVISTLPQHQTVVAINKVNFFDVSRYVVDLEPNVASQHIAEVWVLNTKTDGTPNSRGQIKTYGWLIRHSGCCDQVYASNNTWRGQQLPSGFLGPGTWGL